MAAGSATTSRIFIRPPHLEQTARPSHDPRPRHEGRLPVADLAAHVRAGAFDRSVLMGDTDVTPADRDMHRRVLTSRPDKAREQVLDHAR